MKKVLVTGASGFLGRHLVKRLNQLGWSISISNTKVANLSDHRNLYIYNDIKFDYIFHLAAKTKAGDWCKYHKGEQWIENQQINTNILKYWHENQPQSKLITFGTSCSYGPSSLPMPEDDYMKYDPDFDLYTYAMTKRMLLVGCQSLAAQYGLKYIYYVPSTLFGPDFDVTDTHFIFDLIKKISAGYYNNEIVQLWGNGSQKRELVYIDDVLNIILNTLHLENEVLNIGCGEDYSIKEYAKMISNILSYPEQNIQYDTSKFVGVSRKILDITKLKSCVNKDFVYTPLYESLQETINYFLKEKKYE